VIICVALPCVVARADQAEDTFNSLYAKDFRAAQATADKADDVALARQFVESAKVATSHPKLLALLCEKAYVLAANTPDGYQTAVAAMKLLAQKQPHLSWRCQEKILTVYQTRYNVSRVTNSPDRHAAGDALVELLRALAEKRAAENNYTPAVAYMLRASYVAKAVLPGSEGPIVARRARLMALQRTQAEIDRLAKQLAAEPGNSKARQRLVFLHVIEKDDPAAAGTYLNADCDQAMRTYVPAAARKVESVADTVRLGLGEWYRGLSRQASPTAKPAMLRRAKSYYESFLLKHPTEDAARAKATLALQKIGRALGTVKPPPSPWRPPISPDPEAGKPSSVIRHMKLVSAPGTVKGVLSWTLETRRPRDILRAVAFRPDGRQLAAGGVTGAIRLLKPASGELERVLMAHEDDIHDLAYSPDGSILASASRDGTTRLWDVSTGRPLRTLRGKVPVTRVVWSPDGQWLAEARGKGVRVWRVEPEKQLAVLHVEDWIRDLAWSGDGKLLATSYGRGFRIWDGKTGRQRYTRGHGKIINRLTFSPDGKTLALGESSTPDPKKILLWKVGSKGLGQAMPGGFATGVQGLSWSPDGKKLLCATWDGVAHIYDVASRKPVVGLAGLQGLRDLAFSPDGRTVACAAEVGKSGTSTVTLKLLEAETGLDVWTQTSRVAPLQYSVFGREQALLLLRGPQSKETHRLWRIRSGTIEEMASFRTVGTMAFSPDGKTLAVGLGKEGPGGSWVSLFSLDTAGAPRHVKALPVEGAGVGRVWWMPDGKKLLALRSGQLWSFGSQSDEPATMVARGVYGPLALSPDGHTMASRKNVDRAASIVVHDLASRKKLRELSPIDQELKALTWSPDGNMVASAHRSGRTVIAFSDFRTGVVHRTFDGPNYHVRSLAFSPDGQILAVGGVQRHGDRTVPEVWLYDTKSGRSRGVLRGYRGDGWVLGWLDNATLLSRGGRALRLWDVRAKRPLATIVSIGDDAAIAVGPKGHYRLLGEVAAEKELVYVVHTSTGSEVLAPSAFAKKYGWKNEPNKIGQ